jgi:putative transposase
LPWRGSGQSGAENRIAEELAIKLGVKHSTSTIRRYMVKRRGPRGGQTWRTFIKNHASQIFACDFLTQYTAFFTVVYIFVVMEIASRRIVLINATTSPGLAWVQQQIRQATAWGKGPRFLLHDNDGIFGQFRDRRPRGKKGRRYRCRLDLWLADVMGIEGIPIPYGAPNANPYAERVVGTLRRELLDHMIVMNEQHLRRLLRRYVSEYYHPCRTHLSLGKDAPEPRAVETPERGRVVEFPLVGGLHHRYSGRAA